MESGEQRQAVGKTNRALARERFVDVGVLPPARTELYATGPVATPARTRRCAPALTLIPVVASAPSPSTWSITASSD